MGGRLWEMVEACRELEEMVNVKIQDLTPRVSETSDYCLGNSPLRTDPLVS